MIKGQSPTQKYSDSSHSNSHTPIIQHLSLHFAILLSLAVMPAFDVCFFFFEKIDIAVFRVWNCLLMFWHVFVVFSTRFWRVNEGKPSIFRVILSKSTFEIISGSRAGKWVDKFYFLSKWCSIPGSLLPDNCRWSVYCFWRFAKADCRGITR